MARKALAFTLVELLVCIAIVLLLLGLLLPALGQAKREGRKADATVKLRNVGAALLMYHEVHGDWPLHTLDPLFDAGYWKDPNYLLERGVDPFPQGYAKARKECDMEGPTQSLDIPRYPTSYDDILTFDVWDGHPVRVLLRDLLKHDQNPGLASIRVFGDDVNHSSSCRDLGTRYYGTTIRVCVDGSVKRGHYRDVNPETGSYRYCEIGIFTDVPPEIACAQYRDPQPE